MSFKVLACAVAVLLIHSPNAVGQSHTLDAVPVPDNEIDRVLAHCEALHASSKGAAAHSNGSASSHVPNAEQKVDFDSIIEQDVIGTPTNSGAISTQETVDNMSDYVASDRAIDLKSVDLNDCRQGGFIEN